MTPLSFLAVFLGGGVGATCRYGIGRFVGERYGGTFPLGTFLINVSGCFAIGLLSSLLTHARHSAALLSALLTTGFLGGYTTFSTFTLEGLVLWEEGSRRTALAALVVPILAGLVAAALGAWLAAAVSG